MRKLFSITWYIDSYRIVTQLNL
ncbi:conserved protein of unknown function [Pseudomonas marincola]|uniref:Uncharacterized protein n=1 Tax=Pseudomonas marincola TaxID=437900 RepID=A0A653E3P4_9PSED|nr:conserved protein of unknown function [Pseudomonas marincola]